MTISKFVQLFGKKYVLQVSQTNASVSNDKSLLIVRSHKNCDLINQPRAPETALYDVIHSFSKASELQLFHPNSGDKHLDLFPSYPPFSRFMK